jgi:hypothetical protein
VGSETLKNYAWQQQRLNWLEYFQLGTIEGELLRDAIADSNDECWNEWLKNISVSIGNI